MYSILFYKGERLFLFFIKKAVIGSKRSLQPIKIEEKQGAVQKV